ncbi:SURF1 family protein [Pseudomonas sp. DWP3-1-2]|uniref:SURF1 family protein n=1 Tax=Pseudomonas sp. DWP3-1-2 TaxID=2804645 RepID=UPI003CE87B22
MKRFAPGLLPSLMVLILLPCLIALGFWQLGRGEEKRVMLAHYAERGTAAPVRIEQLPGSPDPAYRHVQLRGRFDPEHSLLLDNRLRDGKVGVELLQPFQDQASGLWVLLNRGWLPWPDRRTPPAFQTPVQVLDVDAWVYVAPGASFQLHADSAQAPWPRLVTAVDASALWAQLGREGFPLELRMASALGAYRLGWPVVAMGPEKHLGYAVQWFSLAIALSGLYLYLGWHTAQNNNKKAKEDRHGNGHEPHPHV